MTRLEFGNNYIPRNPIPQFNGYVEQWKSIPIVECGQPLICLNDIQKTNVNIICSPMYYAQGLDGSSEQMFIREGATSALIKGSELLPFGYKLIIYDAYRSPESQKALFERERLTMKNKFPNFTSDEIDSLIQQYVALPSWDKLQPSPHGSGGAIDLSILKPNGDVLEMGTEVDSLDETSHTGYFMDSSDIDKIIFHRNRQFLYDVMIEAGFTNYPGEWWHFDFGNRTYAAIKGERNAIYGLPDKTE
jgi:D-alanyl-D-alanine dipeptidase